MARTKLFQRLTKALNFAVYQERMNISDRHMRQAIRALRDGAPLNVAAQELDRRRFIVNSSTHVAGLSLLSACSTFFPKQDKSQASNPTGPKVVIVGAGAAGLTTAYRLMTAGLDLSVFEGGNRSGGRMYTELNVNADQMFIERGGEFIDTDHEDIINLCKDVGIEIQDLAIPEFGELNEYFFIGNKMHSEDDVIAAFKPLAIQLAKDVKAAFSSGEVEVPTYNSPLAKVDALVALDRMVLKDYLNKSKADQWLIDLIDVAYVGEYGLSTDKQSALNLILLIEPDTSDGFYIFGSSDESKRIKGGNQKLPLKLAEIVSQKFPIHYEHRLQSIVDLGTSLKLTFSNGGKTLDITADKVVLAIPMPLLRGIDFSQVALSPVKRKAIAEWGFGTNSKMMMGFNARRWNDLKQGPGFSLYSNTDVQELWDTSQNQPGSNGLVTCFLGGDQGLRIPQGLTQKALDLMELSFPGAKNDFNQKTYLQHWPSDSLTKGSYTCSLPGQYTSVYGAPSEPELGGRLIFAGEHCSVDWSGYMNGAVQSGNLAAQSVITP